MMADHDRRTWIAEYADQPQLFTTYHPRFSGGYAPADPATPRRDSATPGLADTYYAQCRAPGAIAPPTSSTSPAPGAPPNFTPCPSTPDASVPIKDAAPDADPPDAMVDAGVDPDASDPDAGDLDAGT